MDEDLPTWKNRWTGKHSFIHSYNWICKTGNAFGLYNFCYQFHLHLYNRNIVFCYICKNRWSPLLNQKKIQYYKAHWSTSVNLTIFRFPNCGGALLNMNFNIIQFSFWVSKDLIDIHKSSPWPQDFIDIHAGLISLVILSGYWGSCYNLAQ